MFDHTHRLGRLAGLGAAVVTAAVVAPTAIADPPTTPLPTPQVSSPRLGEHLSSRDRVWLTRSSKSGAPRLGEQLSGADRSWLTVASGERPEPQPSNGGFDWGDAGIGAGFAFAAVVLGAGGALAIRKHPPLAH
jgi:hypothetical protein